MTKTVLCFGDSNTWGCVPVTFERYPKDIRYPGVLAQELGSEYDVISEGLNDRTTVFFDLVRPNRCGIKHLEPILLSHLPLDYLVLNLGSNDTKVIYQASAEEIGIGLGNMINKAKQVFLSQNSDAKIIILAPVPLKAMPENFMMDITSENKAARLAEVYKPIADLHGCSFLDLGAITSDLGEDGVHLNPGAHKAIGKALAELILNNS
ncbi:MAG: GDSL family lipase [Clostridiaceae bacterium]|nr:GDSL family lipase [Clostridiaceae bacterium]